MLALLLLLGFGVAVLVVFPRQSRLAGERRDRMTSFMEQDYTCCELSTARSEPRCEGVLREVRSLSRGGGPAFAAPAANALANCEASELIDFAGDAAVVRQPLEFLASKIRGPDAAAAQRAVRLLLSDAELARETARNVQAGTGPGALELVAALAALLGDEKEPETAREKAGALLAELGGAAVPAVPALTRALDSRSPAVRRSAAATLAGMGLPAIGALPALTRRAHREPVPGLRQDLLVELGRLDAVTGCCYALFKTPDPLCDESLAAIARHDRQPAAPDTDLQLSEVCPAALVLEVAGNPEAIAHPMPYFEQALRAPDIRTRRRAAVSVAMVAGTLRWRGRIDRSTVEALQEGLRSGIPALVLDSAEALRQIGDASPPGGFAAAPEMFLSTLEDQESDRRAAAAWALGQIGGPAAPAVPTLRDALASPDEALADNAYEALNRIAVANGLDRLGFKTDGKYPLRPDVLERLLAASRGADAATP